MADYSTVVVSSVDKEFALSGVSGDKRIYQSSISPPYTPSPYSLAIGKAVCVCYLYQYIPPVAAIPEQRFVSDLTGWNARATSEKAVPGNCFTQFDMPLVTGAVVGFNTAHIDTDPRKLPHAFYFYVENGAYYYCVYEYGVKKTAPVVRATADDVFRIDRKGDLIRYYVNLAIVHTSPAFSKAPFVVGACLYGNDDGVN